MNYGKQLKTDSECSQFDIKVNQSAGDVKYKVKLLRLNLRNHALSDVIISYN